MSIVRDFILIVVKVKQRGERSQRFPLNNSGVKLLSECSQRFPCSQRFSFNKGGVKLLSECCQRFPFNSSEVKQLIECSQ